MTHLCRSLRWKTLHARPSWTEAELAELFAENEVPYTCLRTAQPWGPDDAACAPERCTPERGCFAPSSRVVRPIA